FQRSRKGDWKRLRSGSPVCAPDIPFRTPKKLTVASSPAEGRPSRPRSLGRPDRRSHWGAQLHDKPARPGANPLSGHKGRDTLQPKAGPKSSLEPTTFSRYINLANIHSPAPMPDSEQDSPSTMPPLALRSVQVPEPVSGFRDERSEPEGSVNDTDISITATSGVNPDTLMSLPKPLPHDE